MATFKQTIEGMKAMEQPENGQPKQHQVTEAKVPEGRFLKDDPYYKLVADKKPKAYREHLFYPEGDKLALHGTAGERLGEFATEDEVKKFVDDKYSQNQPKADKKSLFDEYQLATPEGRKASSDFLKEMGVQNVHALTNEQYNDLARKAMERFGIDDFKLAQEFIQSNDESDRAWDEMAKARQPKDTIKLNLFGNKPKTQWKFANKAVDEPENPTKETNVREWVRKNYPTEFQTDDIRGDLTFDDLYKAMQSGEANDFYKYASEGGRGFDSAVREEIFNGLAQHYGKPYDHFYNLWLNGPEQNK